MRMYVEICGADTDNSWGTPIRISGIVMEAQDSLPMLLATAVELLQSGQSGIGLSSYTAVRVQAFLEREGTAPLLLTEAFGDIDPGAWF